ncbi:glucose PTS transporter subunit IIA [Microbacterium sp.]|uniref:glucose PTS transporter subunit IIA n=1 Tax=Microbacterium sp. TaxID=51671 RepID=UPI00322142F9
MSEVKTLASQVGDLVGGPENVSWVGSCTTRLRFVVRDESRVDFDGLNDTPGVLQAVKAGGQVQVVIGTHVEQVRDELYGRPGWKSLKEGAGAAGATDRKSPLDVVFGFLGGTFQPLIGPITGAAMVQVLALLLIQFGALKADEPTALILNATGNAIFYFLPIFVAFTATQKLGANPFVGATIAAALLHPSFTAIGQVGDLREAFALPLFIYSYASSMFPALLIALALFGLDRLLKRVLPKALQQVFVPTLELLVLVPLTVLVFGPIGVVVGEGIGAGVTWLSQTAPFLFYVLVPAFWFILVAMGIHWALISIAIADLAATGTSVILGAAVGYQYAVFGVALGVLIKVARGRGDRTLRDTAAAAALAVGIGGITEPTIYGFVLRYRRILVIQIVSAAASGVVLGFVNAVMAGFSPAPILGLPLMVPVAGAVVALVVGLVVPIVLIQIWGYEKKADAVTPVTAPETVAGGFQGAVDGAAIAHDVTIAAPIAGTVVPLAETGEPVFSAGLIGPGVSIAPASGRVVAPADGTVVAVPPSAHAIGLRTDDGVELLIHVGIDTVKLNGTHFTPRVRQGQRVARGDLLLEFDAAAITAAGYSLITPVVVTNVAAGQVVDVVATASTVTEQEPLLNVRAAGA